MIARLAMALGLGRKVLSAGRAIAARTAMMEMTTRSSMRVKARRKAPSSKLQAPEKFQTSSSNPLPDAPFGAWFLELLWSLDVAAWSFVFIRYFQLTILSLFAPAFARTAGSTILSGPADQTITCELPSKKILPETVVGMRPLTPPALVLFGSSAETAVAE